MALADNKENQAVQLLFACIKGDKSSLVKQLQTANKGCDIVNICREDGWTAVHYASSAGKKEIVEVLALWGANLDCKTALSLSTPLHLAAKRGHLVIVRTLLELGANSLLMDANGWTPGDIAHACGHDDIAALIRSKSKQQFVAHGLFQWGSLKQLITSRISSDEVKPGLTERNPLTGLNPNTRSQQQSPASVNRSGQFRTAVCANSEPYSSQACSTAKSQPDNSVEILRRLASFRRTLEPLRAAEQSSIAALEQSSGLDLKSTSKSQQLSTLRCLQQVSQKLSKHLVGGSHRQTVKSTERWSMEFR